MLFRSNSYRDLLVWHRSMQLAEEVYRATTDFPRTETYGLSAQLQRSVTSVASNIAEGHARNSTAEFLRFISIALGSIAESETQLTLAQRLTYLHPESCAKLLKQADEVGKMLRGLQRTLRKRAEARTR